ncbi:hypothetical protein SNEBB_007421 [Seison nebaliae]|nr:hypothetical protein SNEBB_007421 [Seison nebaliae]
MSQNPDENKYRHNSHLSHNKPRRSSHFDKFSTRNSIHRNEHRPSGSNQRISTERKLEEEAKISVKRSGGHVSKETARKSTFSMVRASQPATSRRSSRASKDLNLRRSVNPSRSSLIHPRRSSTRLSRNTRKSGVMRKSMKKTYEGKENKIQMPDKEINHRTSRFSVAYSKQPSGISRKSSKVTVHRHSAYPSGSSIFLPQKSLSRRSSSISKSIHSNKHGSSQQIKVENKIQSRYSIRHSKSHLPNDVGRTSRGFGVKSRKSKNSTTSIKMRRMRKSASSSSSVRPEKMESNHESSRGNQILEKRKERIERKSKISIRKSRSHSPNRNKRTSKFSVVNAANPHDSVRSSRQSLSRKSVSSSRSSRSSVIRARRSSTHHHPSSSHGEGHSVKIESTTRSRIEKKTKKIHHPHGEKEKKDRSSVAYQTVHDPYEGRRPLSTTQPKVIRRSLSNLRRKCDGECRYDIIERRNIAGKNYVILRKSDYKPPKRTVRKSSITTKRSSTFRINGKVESRSSLSRSHKEQLSKGRSSHITCISGNSVALKFDGNKEATYQLMRFVHNEKK